MYNYINKSRKVAIMEFLEERIKLTVDNLKNRQYKSRTKLDNLVFCTCGYKTENRTPVDAEYIDYSNFAVDNGSLRGGEKTKDLHLWVKGRIELPDDYKGKTYDLIFDTEMSGPYFSRPQVLIFIDGKNAGAFDRTHLTFRLDGDKKSFDIWFYMYYGPSSSTLKADFYLGELDVPVFDLYYDLMVGLDVLEAQIDKNTRQYYNQKYILNDAVNMLDLSLDYDSFISSVKKCSEFLAKEFYDKEKDKSDVTVNVIGHTHIDVAWLWTFAQTREKTQRSFSNFISLLKRYPEFRFMHSTPQVYQFVKEDCPELYEEIKEKVKEGVWQPEGSMWVEADCNLTSGEGLVRQLLLGKKFFKDEFGCDNRILWLPDVFGYSANLPQILKKSNVDYFVTSKISWNETNLLPYDVFNWVGIDGTKIFSYFLTAQNISKNGPGRIVTYNGNTSAQMVNGTYKRFQQKQLLDEVMLTYGDGDGGGGPNQHQIEMAKRMTKGVGSSPKVQFEQPLAFLDRAYEKTKDSRFLPTWNGELYLEFHRGTYTSQAKNKKMNRTCEFMYQNIETSALIAGQLLGEKYPIEYLDKSWKDILMCQFHDVVPGSSIREVYDDTDRIYAHLTEDGEKYLDTYRKEIKDNIKTDGGILVFNNNSFDSSSTIEHDGKYIYVENIPSKGYCVTKAAETITPTVKMDERVLENSFMRVEFDENMNIKSVYDKENECELIKSDSVANRIVGYEDYPREYDNWEISEYIVEKAHYLDKVSDVTPFENGEIAGFKVVRKFNNSTITQDIYLYGHENKICFKTHADIHEHHILFKSIFPIDVNTNVARFDIQYGNVERSTHKNTSWDEARFEVCMHKFADLSQYDHGVTFINDCKYGCSVDGSTFALTMIKTGTFPDSNADNGEHDFTYEFVPHKGDMFEYGNIRKAYELNNKLVSYNVGKQDGKLPESYSYVRNSAKNVFTETIKKCETSDDVVVRLSEQFGANARGKLEFGFDVKEAYLCDLMENNLEKLNVENNSVEYTIKPYEILSIKIAR